MTRQFRQLVSLLLVGLTICTGCHPTQPFYFRDDGDLSHYMDKAIRSEYPDVMDVPLAEVTQSLPPLTVSNPDFNQPWDITLEEVVAIALQNSKTIRSLAQVSAFGFSNALSVSPSNGSNPALVTIYDPAAAESDPQSGVEAALSQFDALLRITEPQGGSLYSKTDRPLNSTPANPFTPTVSDRNTGGWRTELQKRTATGTIFSIINETEYDRTNTNIPFRQLNSTWETNWQVQMRQPLLRGRGTQVNRIPIVIARINTDVSLTQFEAAVRNLVMDVENAYWDLYLAYRNLDTAKSARDSSHGTWQVIYERFKKGSTPAGDEAQSRGQFFAFEAQTQQALDGIFARENRIRWLMGLAVADGRLLRPADEPTSAKVDFDWHSALHETIARSPELRQTRWLVKRRELELVLSRNQLLPQLDVTANYGWYGIGDQLINASPNGINFPNAGSTAYEELTAGNFQEFRFGFEFQLPIGFRAANAAVKNSQFQLARSKAQLEDQELAEQHLLADTLRTLNGHYRRSQTYLQQWIASEEEVRAHQALYEGGKESLDFLLDSQRRRAQAQNDYYTAVAEYNKWLAQVHFRKGSLLEHDGITLEEGAWPEKAYWDALGRARARDASYYLDYGWTRPRVISQGPVEQHWNTTGSNAAAPSYNSTLGSASGAQADGDKSSGSESPQNKPGVEEDAAPSPDPTPAREAPGSATTRYNDRGMDVETLSNAPLAMHTSSSGAPRRIGGEPSLPISETLATRTGSLSRDAGVADFSRDTAPARLPSVRHRR